MASMKKMAVLTIPPSDAVPIPTPGHIWPKHPVVKDSFRNKALSEPVEANSALECRSSDSCSSGTPLDRQV